MITVLQLASWIVVNRRGKAFQGYSLDKIIHELLHCECVCITENLAIYGVACGQLDHEAKTMYIYDVLSVHKDALKRMLKYFKMNWPNYSIEGKRKNGKRIAYNVDRLMKKVIAYGK